MICRSKIRKPVHHRIHRSRDRGVDGCRWMEEQAALSLHRGSEKAGSYDLAAFISRKYRFALATSLKICAFRASGVGHFRSPRNRNRNSTSMGVWSFKSIGSKLRMCDSTAKDASPKGGRLPTLGTAWNVRPPTVSRVT